jgi:hypothetical protein
VIKGRLLKNRRERASNISNSWKSPGATATSKKWGILIGAFLYLRSLNAAAQPAILLAGRNLRGALSRITVVGEARMAVALTVCSP